MPDSQAITEVPSSNGTILITVHIRDLLSLAHVPTATSAHLAPGMHPPHSDTDDTYDADEEDSVTIRTRRGTRTSVLTAGDPPAAPGPDGELRGIASLWSRFSPRTLSSTGLGIASIALYISDSVILPMPPKWHDAFQVTAPSKVGGVKACFQPPISGMRLDSSNSQGAVFRFPNGPFSLPMPCWEVDPDTGLFTVLGKGPNDEVLSQRDVQEMITAADSAAVAIANG